MKKRLEVLWEKIFSVDYTPRYARLAGEIECYKPQLKRRIAETKSDDAEWAKQAQELVRIAEHFLKESKIDEGWKAFHAAKRLEINGMNETERMTLANELRKETCKLNEWRKEAILEMIGKTKEEMKTAPPCEVLSRAIELKDEHYNNQYYKNKLSRSLFRLLFGLLLILIAGIIIYFFLLIRKYGPDFGNKIQISVYILGVLLFGFLGAITSAILFTRYLSKNSRVTEIGSSRVITLSKIFVGAAFSLFLFLLLRSSVAESIKIFNFSIKDPLDYFAIAFISGFSERLAQKAIEAVVGQQKEEAGKPDETAET